MVHDPHRHAIFAYPYSLLRRGIVLGYEYAVPDTRLGLIVEYSFERRARGALEDRQQRERERTGLFVVAANAAERCRRPR